MEDQEVNATLQNKNFWNGSGHTDLNNVEKSAKLQRIVADGSGKCNDAGSVAEGSVRGERNKIITTEDFLPVLVGVWMKMSPEIRHAYKILREILSDKTKSVIEPFLSAVNPDEYPDYYDVIKEPMDLFKSKFEIYLQGRCSYCSYVLIGHFHFAIVINQSGNRGI